MIIESTFIPGVKIIQPTKHEDDRGMFFEWFRSDLLKSHTGTSFDLAQANCSISKKDVIRGIHFAGSPPGQAKYVTCISGAIRDVVVDLRIGSPTFGKSDTFELSAENRKAIFIPSGIGHGFISLKDESIAVYLCDQKFNPDNEFAIHPLDSDLNLDWPVNVNPILSPKDAAAPSFNEVQELLPKFIS